MPPPIEPSQRYVAGLDGIRAVAVLCVIAYHLNIPSAQGGMLGVGVFFTLSGYLITDLLLESYRRYGHLGLGQFWLARARRLLPALFLLLAAVSVWVSVFDASQLAEIRRQVVSAALYFANWSTIAAHGSYFARFAPPLPLDHLWSLAIEEQFYLVWPWLLWLAIRVLPGRRALAVATLAGAAGSAFLMSHLYHPGYDPTRAYEGTDTRAFGLLIGAALAILRPIRASRFSARPSAQGVLALDVMGAAGLVCIIVLVWRTNPFSAFLYPFGFLVLSVATVAMIAAVVNSASALGFILGCAPLRWIGMRSYGIYLWQWPIVVLWGQSDGRFHLARAALQVALALLVASVSWRYVEEPIRQGALGHLWRRARTGAGGLRTRRSAFAFSSTLGVMLLVAAVLGLNGLLPVSSAGLRSPTEISKLPPRLPRSQSVADRASVRHLDPRPVPATRTSCRSVVYIGDSTSEGETSTDYIPNPLRRLSAQLARVGVGTTFPEISGGRSIVETVSGNSNAASVVRQRISEGFQGCWILALGTNDVADVGVGSSVGMAARIARMMAAIGDQRVLWVDVLTLLTSGPYSENGMQHWNDDLLAACRRYPYMRVFDWAGRVKKRWFIPDGIHYYSPGYIARGHDIAHALVEAFPKGEPASATCLVG